MLGIDYKSRGDEKRLPSTVASDRKSNRDWPWETSSLPMDTDLNTFLGLAVSGSYDLRIKNATILQERLNLKGKRKKGSCRRACLEVEWCMEV